MQNGNSNGTSTSTTTANGQQAASTPAQGAQQPQAAKGKGTRKGKAQQAAKAAQAAKQPSNTPSVKRLTSGNGALATTGYGQQHTIRVSAAARATNPKRPQTKAHAAFALVQQHHGQTVGQFARAWAQAKNKGQAFTQGKTPASELSWCIAKGFISLTPPKGGQG